MRAGALGYILKNALPAELLQAIRQVSRGVITIQPALLQQLFRQHEKIEEKSLEELTGREYEVLKLVARGLDNDSIAETLHISKRTVNVHITNIKSKLNLANRAQITLYALSHGMLGLFDGNKV